MEFFACDVERSSIEWLQASYPGVRSHANDYAPPLKYEAAAFDLIYSISIFSHLTSKDCDAWLDEFARVTKPGGVCCLTVMGYPALKSGTTDFGADYTDRLSRDGTLHYDYDFLEAERKRHGGLVGDKAKTSFLGLDYGVTFFTSEYIQAHWNSDRWRVAGIAEGVIDDLQDLVVLKRL